MTVQTFEYSPEQLAATITVTAAAATHLRTHLARLNKSGVRLSLKEAGCTGFKYVIADVDAAEPGDLVVEPEKGVKVYVDRAHAAAFKGLCIDYKTEGLNKQLVMNNPNIKDECGCGESFNV